MHALSRNGALWFHRCVLPPVYAQSLVKICRKAYSIDYSGRPAPRTEWVRSLSTLSSFFFLLLFLSHAIATRADFPCAYIHTHRLLIVRGLTRQLQPPSPCASFWKSGNSLLLERSKRQLLLVQHLTSPSLISSIFIATKISPGHESCYIYQTRKRLI
jgi:hypothetical protein